MSDARVCDLYPPVSCDRFLPPRSVVFARGGISAHACSYLHNYSAVKDDPLFVAQFKEQIVRFPVFTADHVPDLTAFLDQRIRGGDGGSIAATVEQSKYRPSKKLLDHVAKLIKGKPEYVLLDEQLVVYDKVVEAAKRGVNGKKKAAIIVKALTTGNHRAEGWPQ
jgi:hypothetical protein